MAIIPNGFSKAVVAIGVQENEEISWCGTGFLVYRVINESRDLVPILVTNKHVLEGRKEIVVRLKHKDSDAVADEKVPLYKGDEIMYKVHPDPNIDIAAMLLNGSYIMEKQIEFSGFNIDKDHTMTTRELKESGVEEGSLVYMLGFTMGLVNMDSTDPICRLGCIARMSSAQLLETKNILVDIQNFPGNSGSPIILRPEHMSIEGTPCLDKSLLVGIVHSYIPYVEKLMNIQTGKIVEVRSENSGLAYVHHVEYIREVIDLLVKPYNSKQVTGTI